MGFDRKIIKLLIALIVLVIGGVYFHPIYYIVLFLGVYIFVKYAFIYGISFLFFLLPFAQVFKINPASTSLFTYIMIAFIIIDICKKGKINKNVLIQIFVISLYFIIGAGNDVTILIKLIAGLFLLYECVVSLNENDFNNLVLAFSSGIVVSSIMGWQKDSNPRLIAYYSDFNMDNIAGHVLYRFSGLYEDPNYYSIGAALAVVACLMVFLKGKKSRWLMLILGIVIAIFGALTYSRMFIVAFVLMIILVLKELFRYRKHFFISLCGIFISFIIMFKVINRTGILTGIISRFQVADISNNRSNIWSNYIHYITTSVKRMLVGDGIGAKYYNNVGPHNTYIELLYFLGIIGTVMIIGYIIYVIRLNIGKNTRRLINYVGMILFLTMIFSLGVLRTIDVAFYIVIIWMMTIVEMDNRIEIRILEEDSIL